MDLTWHEKQLLKPTDTDVIITRALDISEKHIWYQDSGKGYSHRYNVTFYTEEEKLDFEKYNRLPFGKVDRNSSYGTERFKRALIEARKM